MEINKIYNMDCLEGMKLIDGNSIDLVVTSPPYNIGLDYGHGWDSDKISTNEYKSFTKKWLEEVFRILKDDGRFCLNIGYRVCTVEDSGIDYNELIDISRSIGFKLRETIVWIKTRERGNPQSFCGANTAWGSWLSASNPICRSYFEFIFVFYKKYLGKQNKGKSTMTKKEFLDYTQNAWFFPAETDRTHPAPFPLELPLRCIKFFTYEGDVILDPFMGSGTTAEACIRLNRQYIGFEISKFYCDDMKCRTEQMRLK